MKDKNIEYCVETLEKILNIPSVAGDTEEMTEYLLKECRNLNLNYERTKKGALRVLLPGEDNENKRLVTAHIDTLGAMVEAIKPNGRLRLSPIGGFAWNAYEGENVKVHTRSTTYTGTILPEKASVHIFSDEVRTCERTDEFMEVRLDEMTQSKEETMDLGICPGDFVSMEPRFERTSNGYIKSRYLDDKACVACLLAVLKEIKEDHLKIAHSTYVMFSDYEEIGHGAYAIPDDIFEMVAVDIGTVGGDCASREDSVTLVAKDSRTPYPLAFRRYLEDLCEENGISYVVDVHRRYGSDASMAALQGRDLTYACLGPGVDATHHYERTHINALVGTMDLIKAYLTKKSKRTKI